MSYLIAIFGTLVTSLISDYAGYFSARAKWVDGGKQGNPPPWDWPLFFIRILVGVATGVLAAAGFEEYAR